MTRARSSAVLSQSLSQTQVLNIRRLSQEEAEAKTGVFTTLLQKFGVKGLEVTEIYDIEPWATDHLKPHGLIFCYMCNDSDSANASELEDEDAESVWFANQLSDDACASHALLNVLLNCPHVDLGEELREMQAVTAEMPPVVSRHLLRALVWVRQCLECLVTRRVDEGTGRVKLAGHTGCTQFSGKVRALLHPISTTHPVRRRPADLRGALQAIAHSTLEADKARAKAAKGPPTKKRKTTGSPSKAKKADTDVQTQEQYHFIGYVPAHGKVWELDGLQRSAIEVGELNPQARPGDWMNVVRPALRMKMHAYMDSENDHVQYNLLAIVDEKYLSTSDELEMRKRERHAIERRLQEAYPEGWSDKVSDVVLAAVATQG